MFLNAILEHGRILSWKRTFLVGQTLPMNLLETGRLGPVLDPSRGRVGEIMALSVDGSSWGQPGASPNPLRSIRITAPIPGVGSTGREIRKVLLQRRMIHSDASVLSVLRNGVKTFVSLLP